MRRRSPCCARDRSRGGGGRTQFVTPPPGRSYAWPVRVPPGQDAVRAAYADAFDRACQDGDVDGMATAALGLASLQRFGEPVGRLPAVLHQAYLESAALPATRARLAAALARAWAYGYDPQRGRPFAREAVALAETLDDARLLAGALDAHLATCWGPDDLSERLHITARLREVTAHLDDEQPRLDAHLWRLTTALETVDVLAVHRELAALDVLADETGSPTVRYFATARRAMHAILVGDYDEGEALVAATDERGAEAAIPDAFGVYHTLRAELARQTGDRDVLKVEAELYESHAVEHGIQSLLAEAAVLWLEVGDTDRAGSLAVRAAGVGLHTVPRDVDFLLTVSKVVEAAAGSGNSDLAGEGIELLRPYCGRAVVNAGAVTCQGVVDDYLWRAATLVGDPHADEWRAAAVAAYRKLNASWWLRRVTTARRPSAQAGLAARVVHLRPLPGGAAWSVGADGAQQMLPDMKGLHYLRALLMRPTADVPALELAALIAGHATVVSETHVGERADRKALASYRERLRDIDRELAEAQGWADAARVERLSDERDALVDEIRGATGLGGRPRVIGGNAERARVAVRKAIAAALSRVKEHDATTARLLRASVHTGGVCRYDPDPDSPISWVLRDPS